MNVKKRIKSLREEQSLSQEQMAEKLHMSASAYAKLERGETHLNLYKLEQIANIFKVDISELISPAQKNVFFVMNENGKDINYYGDNDVSAREIEKLELIIAHKDEIIAQKNAEIAVLKEMVTLLKQRESV